MTLVFICGFGFLSKSRIKSTRVFWGNILSVPSLLLVWLWIFLVNTLRAIRFLSLEILLLECKTFCHYLVGLVVIFEISNFKLLEDLMVICSFLVIKDFCHILRIKRRQRWGSSCLFFEVLVWNQNLLWCRNLLFLRAYCQHF